LKPYWRQSHFNRLNIGECWPAWKSRHHCSKHLSH